MRKCRPGKWVPWAIAGAGLPLLAAAMIQTKTLQSDISDRARTVLAADESLKWANIALDGRDATVSGTATSQAAVDAAVAAVRNTYGVRTVASAAQVVEPVKLVAPTIESLSTDSVTPEIKGTWPEGPAKTLAVTVAGTTYTLGENPELSSASGNWLLKLAQPLSEGTYDVTAEISDGADARQMSEAPGKLVIDLPDAPPPDITAPEPAAITRGGADSVTGTWPEGDAVKLTAALQGREYVLDRGAALARNKDDNGAEVKGTFEFKPTITGLAPGSYDVDFTTFDAAGNMSKMTATAAIIVPEPAPPPDTAAPEQPAVTASEANVVKGRWPEGDAVRLSATLQGREYVLGRGAALMRDTDDKGAEIKGTFRFQPATARLAPGTYDVDFAAYDAAGNVSTMTAKSAIAVAEPAKVEPKPAPEPEPEPQPVAPPAPAVTKQLDLTGAPIVRGTWEPDKADTLVVSLAGRNYQLNVDANLASDDKGNWRLLPAAALKDGIYDIVATAFLGDLGKKDETVAELEVDATPPAIPTATAVSGDTSPAAFTGTFDEKTSDTLKVSVPELNLAVEKGAAGSALTSDGEGNWTLALSQTLAPGTYNIVVQTADKYGRMVEDATKDEIVVVAKNTPVPPQPASAFDCEAVMNRIQSVFPMRFVYDNIDFDERFGLSINQYAALLKDPRCASLKVEVGGHADERGSEGYNLGLGDRRAEKVRDMLVEAGVDAARITVLSFGESVPADTAENEEAWAKNRRVEIRIMK